MMIKILLLLGAYIWVLSGNAFAVVWPVSNSSDNNADVLTSAFGPRDKDETAGFEYDFHAGMDIRTPEGEGDDIYAVKAGEVIWAKPNGGYGWMVKIKHADGSITGYGHLEDDPKGPPTNLSLGMQVVQGQHIGEAGGTTGDPPESTLVVHLHLNYYPPGVRAIDLNTNNPLHVLPHSVDTGPGGGSDIYIDSIIAYCSPPRVKVFLHVPGTELDLNRVQLQIWGPEGYFFSKYADFDQRYNVGEQQTVNGVTFYPEDFFVGGDQNLAVEFEVPPFETQGTYTLQVTAVDVDGVEYQKEAEIAVEVSDLHVLAGERQITTFM